MSAPAKPSPPPAALAAAKPAGLAAADPTKGLRDFLNARSGHLGAALPKSKGLTADKFIKLALMAATKQPKLLACEMSSVFSCLMQCAELGLEPSGTLGAAYLVPFEDKKKARTICTLIIGYKGYIDLARRSGVLKQIEAHVVHAKDVFDLRFGLEPKLDHVPYLEAGDPGAPRLVYCVATLADGAKHLEVMTWAEVMRIKARSKTSGNGPWVTDEEAMAKKTVARQTLKWVPMSSELQKAIGDEEEREVGSGSTLDLGSVSAPALPPPPPAANPRLSKAEKEASEIADWAEAGAPAAEAEKQEEAAPAHDAATGEVVGDAEPERELSPAEKDIEALFAAAANNSSLLPAIALIGKLPTAELKAYWKSRYSVRARELGAK